MMNINSKGINKLAYLKPGDVIVTSTSMYLVSKLYNHAEVTSYAYTLIATTSDADECYSCSFTSLEALRRDVSTWSQIEIRKSDEFTIVKEGE